MCFECYYDMLVCVEMSLGVFLMCWGLCLMCLNVLGCICDVFRCVSVVFGVLRYVGVCF